MGHREHFYIALEGAYSVWMRPSFPCQGESVMDRTVSPQSAPVGVLTPGAFECDLIWEKGLYRGDQVTRRSLGWALVQSAHCPYEKGRPGLRRTHGRERIGRHWEKAVCAWQWPFRNPERQTPRADPSLWRSRPCQRCIWHRTSRAHL